jgi:hypothetical protein
MQTPEKNALDMLECLESEIDEAVTSVLGGSPAEEKLSNWLKSIFNNTMQSVSERMER